MGWWQDPGVPVLGTVVGEARPPVKAGRVDLVVQLVMAGAAPPASSPIKVSNSAWLFPFAAKLREDGHPADLG